MLPVRQLGLTIAEFPYVGSCSNDNRLCQVEPCWFWEINNIDLAEKKTPNIHVCKM